MKRPRLEVAIVSLALLALSGCGYTVRYTCEDVQPIVRAGEAPDLLVVDLIDGRGEQGDPRTATSPAGYAYQTLFPMPYYFKDQEWGDLTASFREHVTRAGLAPPGGAVEPAPTTVEEVEAILSRAAAEERAVAFFRLHRASVGGTAATGVLIVRVLAMLGGIGILPFLISESLPINDHLGYGAVELLLVDPVQRTARTFVGEHSTNDFSVVGWSHYPQTQLAPLLKGTIAATLQQAAPALRANAGDSQPFVPELVLRRVPEPDWYPPEGCSAYDPARKDVPFPRLNKDFTNQPGATPPIEPAQTTTPAAQDPSAPANPPAAPGE